MDFRLADTLHLSACGLRILLIHEPLSSDCTLSPLDLSVLPSHFGALPLRAQEGRQQRTAAYFLGRAHVHADAQEVSSFPRPRPETSSFYRRHWTDRRGTVSCIDSRLSLLASKGVLSSGSSNSARSRTPFSISMVSRTDVNKFRRIVRRAVSSAPSSHRSCLS